LLTAASVLYDGVYVPGGTNSVATIEADADAVHFLNEAFKHCKAIAADTAALQVIEATYFAKKVPAEFTDKSVLLDGIVIGDNPSQLADQLILALAQHRFWDREKPRKIPA
jgi:catalase